MVSLEEAIEDTSPNLQNVAPVYKRIILSIKEINWLDKIYYNLRTGIKTENSILDFSGSLLPGKGSKSPIILYKHSSRVLRSVNQISFQVCQNISQTIYGCVDFEICLTGWTNKHCFSFGVISYPRTTFCPSGVMPSAI